MTLLPRAAGTMKAPPLMAVPGSDVMVDGTWQIAQPRFAKICSPVRTSVVIGPRDGVLVERMKSAAVGDRFDEAGAEGVGGNAEGANHTADYALCIYAGASPTLAAQVHVAPGSNWSQLGTKGYKYLDQTFASAGTQKVIVKGTGVAAKTKALLVARGASVPDPIDSAALQEPVVAQLINYESGICWQDTYAAAIKNTTSLYKAKQ